MKAHRHEILNRDQRGIVAGAVAGFLYDSLRGCVVLLFGRGTSRAGSKALCVDLDRRSQLLGIACAQTILERASFGRLAMSAGRDLGGSSWVTASNGFQQMPWAGAVANPHGNRLSDLAECYLGDSRRFS